jgi:hypothetical protein
MDITSRIQRKRVVGGLISEYHRAAWQAQTARSASVNEFWPGTGRRLVGRDQGQLGQAAELRLITPGPLLRVEHRVKDMLFFPKRGDIATFPRTASGAAARRRASWRYTADAVAHPRRRAAHAGRHDPAPGIRGSSTLSGPAWYQGRVDHRKFRRSRRPRHDGGAMVCRERRRSRSDGNVERRPCQGPSRKSLPVLALWVGETAELTEPAGHPASRAEFYLPRPGPEFVAPVKTGDTVKVVGLRWRKRDDRRIIKLRTTAANQGGELVIDGAAVLKKVDL